MPSKMAGNKDSSSSSSPPPSDASGSSTRLQRNLAEKQRRDKLNGYISELATIVPMVSMASKRLDKTSILRLSAAHLRISQGPLGNSRKRTKNFKWRPSYFSTEQIREILESLEGFLLVAGMNGKIIYVSQAVEKFLGHQNIEMIGHSLFTFIHPSDSDMVRDQLETLASGDGKQNGSSMSTSRCSFYCRLRERNQPRSEVLTYQFVHVVGHMSGPIEEEEMDTMDEDSSSTAGSSSSTSTPLNSPILKAYIRVVRSNPYNELSLNDAVENEYVTRHSPTGVIVFADHRISTITGHLPHEVYGKSAYQYINTEDTKIAMFAHKLMFANNGGTGMIVYRLHTRNGSFVYLKTSGYLQFEKASAQVDHFVCVNKQLSEEEGEEELKKFHDRFTPHIGDTCSASFFKSFKAIQDGESLPQAENESSKIGTACTTSMEIETIPSAEQGPNEDANHKTSLHNGVVKASNNLQITFCNRMTERLTLETDLSGRISSNCSPLTDVSLSTNSPQSEDTCTTISAIDAISESVYPLQEVIDTGQPMNELLCSVTVSPFPLASSAETVDPVVSQQTEFLQNDLLAANGSPLIIAEDNLWQESFDSDVLICSSELSLQPLPLNDETSEGSNIDC